MIANRFRRLSSFALFLLEADKGGGGGNPAPKPTLEEQLTQARTDLATAQSSVGTLTAERDTANSERDTARADVTRLTGQFDAANTAATQAQTDLATARTDLSTVTTERDTARTQLAAANLNVSRLESLCKLKGIPADSAVPPVPAPQSERTEEEWVAAYNSAKTPADKAAVLTEMEKASAAKKAAKQGV